MPDVLDFNPNRDLGFDPNRELQFNANRELGFDPARDLGFDTGRDLGFGKRGPVFRGYVCPICGAQVTADQSKCTECGAIFDESGRPPPEKPRIPEETTSARTSSAPAHRMAESPRRIRAPPIAQAYPPPPKRVEGKFCIFCGARLASDDTFCWQCGNRAGA